MSVRPLLAACAFLTSLPVRGEAVEGRDVGRATAWFPAVGGGLGLVLAVVAAAADGRLPPTLVAVALTALLAAMTGGLHLDGVADLFDGRGGWRGDRERMLAIMRDSRLGAHGAVALVLVVLAKTAALTVVVDAGAARALVAFPVVARWCCVALIVWFPYARPEGVGAVFTRDASAREVVIASGVALVTVAVLGGMAYVVAALLTLAVALGLAAWTARALGGLTGDVYGAAIEIAEVAFLFAAIVLAPP